MADARSQRVPRPAALAMRRLPDDPSRWSWIQLPMAIELPEVVRDEVAWLRPEAGIGHFRLGPLECGARELGRLA
jgi:hypothetical protein